MAAWGVFASMTYLEGVCVREEASEGTTRVAVNGAHVVIITMRAVLVALLVNGHVFSEGLFALFTHEGHFCRSRKRMCLCLRVTLGAIEPLLAARGTDGDLCI
jgi:hypothetical protein